jgi:hypothetical protein
LQRAFLLDETASAAKAKPKPTLGNKFRNEPKTSFENAHARTTPHETQNSNKVLVLRLGAVLLITTALLFVPFILAFLTSFYTPTIGLPYQITALLGVYTNCLCTLSVKYWIIRYIDDLNAYVPLGSNSAAQKWWSRGARRGRFYVGLRVLVEGIRRD